jgi:hypothetical protein
MSSIEVHLNSYNFWYLFTYLFMDESGGTYSRPQLFLIPGEGWLSSVLAAFLRGTDGLPAEPGRFHPESDRPSFRSERSSSRQELSSSSSRTGYLRGQGDLPVNGYLFTDETEDTIGRTQIILIPGAERPSSRSRVAILQV